MIPVDRSCLAAVLDRIVPRDDYPSACDAGVLEVLEAMAEGPHERFWRTILTPGFLHLAQEASTRGASSFDVLDDAEQDDVLRSLEAGRPRTHWLVDPKRFLRTLVRLACEAYYATEGSPAWKMVGFEPGAKRDAGADADHRRLRTLRLAQARESYDIVIIGAGAGGGVAAQVIARSGARVLVCERGPFLGYDEVGREHLRNHRLPVYGFNTPPGRGAGPRVLVDAHGREHVLVYPSQPGFGGTPQTVGGGTRVYQGMAWRFLPSDFRMASVYGVPDGSSLADWPMSYDDLEPFYTRAEWEIGVCGDGSSHGRQGRRSRGYPMPPPDWNPEAELLSTAAGNLGWTTGPVPLLMNTQPRDGRGRCVQCGQCVGFACPSDAKNGTFNTTLPQAVAGGNCDVVEQARALRIDSDGRGRVTSVELVDEQTGDKRVVRAGHVVVSGGAVETARLLLWSGLGNDNVGRNLQGHVYTGAFGVFDEVVQSMSGPGARIATCDHNHGLDGAIGGGVLHNEVTKLPIIHWYWALPPDVARWGQSGKEAMRRLYLRTSHINGPIQEIPSPDIRVTLADVTDRHGVPGARLSGRLHPESARAAQALRKKAWEWMEATGAKRVWSYPLHMPDAITAGQHQAGTCRMGDDPATSVTDPFGRVHGHDNLWVMDGSLHVTNGGFNPVLTILALAYRCSEALVKTG